MPHINTIHMQIYALNKKIHKNKHYNISYFCVIISKRIQYEFRIDNLSIR